MKIEHLSNLIATRMDPLLPVSQDKQLLLFEPVINGLLTANPGPLCCYSSSGRPYPQCHHTINVICVACNLQTVWYFKFGVRLGVPSSSLNCDLHARYYI